MSATKIIKATKKTFYVALLWSILFVIGIPMIVIGAVHLTKGAVWIIMMVLGIVFTASGIWGVPLMWVNYAKKRKLQRIAIVISGSESLTIDILSDTIGRTQPETRTAVRELLQKGWLTGYAFVDQEDRVKKTSTLDIHHAVCTYCGASFEFKGTDSRCPYCGRYFTGEPLD